MTSSKIESDVSIFIGLNRSISNVVSIVTLTVSTIISAVYGFWMEITAEFVTEAVFGSSWKWITENGVLAESGSAEVSLTLEVILGFIESVIIGLGTIIDGGSNLAFALASLSGTFESVFWLGVWLLVAPFGGIVHREVTFGSPVNSGLSKIVDGVVGHGINEILSGDTKSFIGDVGDKIGNEILSFIGIARF